MMKSYRRSKAFTLIELLVVVSIIALLVAILLPSLANARKSAYRVKCQAGFHEIGLGVHMYADNYNDRFPDKVTLGGHPFRAAPGYRDPRFDRSLAEVYGLEAILADHCDMAPTPDLWVCPAQPHAWMKELGNTYAFSVAMGNKPRSYLQRSGSATWVSWDNYILKPFTPGRYKADAVSGFSIDPEDRKIPHQYGKGQDTSKAINVLYSDGRVTAQLDQLAQ